MKITSTKSSENHAIKCLIYGESGIGKTYIASTLPGKTLIISAESGLLSLAGFDIDMIDLNFNDSGKVNSKTTRLEEFKKIIAWLHTEEIQKKYNNIFIDSLTEIAQNLVESLLVKYPNRSDALVLWGEYAKEISYIIKLFRDLPKFNVIMTALVKFDKDDTDQRYAMIDLQGSIVNRLPQFFDEVFFYNIILGENKKLVRVLQTSKSDRFVAKDRSGKLLPVEIPNLSAIFDKINKKEETKK